MDALQTAPKGKLPDVSEDLVHHFSGIDESNSLCVGQQRVDATLERQSLKNIKLRTDLR